MSTTTYEKTLPDGSRRYSRNMMHADLTWADDGRRVFVTVWNDMSHSGRAVAEWLREIADTVEGGDVTKG